MIDVIVKIENIRIRGMAPIAIETMSFECDAKYAAAKATQTRMTASSSIHGDIFLIGLLIILLL